MFCTKCGAQNADGVRFCTECGSQLILDNAQQQPTYQQSVYQQPMMYQQPMYQYPIKNGQQVPAKGLGVASLVLGILSLVFWCAVGLSFVLSILGTILGGIAFDRAKQAGMKNGVAVAGLVCSLVSFGLYMILLGIGVVG